MIPPSGNVVVCSLLVDLNSQRFTCTKHGKTFESREALGEHGRKMRRHWLWRHHPFRTLKEVLYANRR